MPRLVADVITVAATLATAVLCAIELQRSGGRDVVHWFGRWTPRNGFALGIDLVAGPLSAGAATFAACVAVAAAVLASRYLDVHSTSFHALLLLFCAGTVGFCLTGDLFNMFVFFELMSVAAYGLTAQKNDELGPMQGALNFAITNSIAGFLILFGIALVYGQTHALNLDQIGRILDTGAPNGLVAGAFTLISAGLLIKAAAVPFHFWLADAHTVAPAAACVVFSGIMVQLGLYGIARVYWASFEGAVPPSTGLRAVFVTLGVLTAVIGSVMCMSQQHLKRLLALSTVSHSGVMLIGVGMLGAKGLAGAGIYVIGHGLVKASLFACTGVLVHRTGKADREHLHGRCRDMPWTAAVWMVGGLALAGMPPFAMYMGNGLIDEASKEQRAGWLLFVGVLASALTGAAVIRAGANVFFGWGPRGSDPTSSRHGAEQRPDTTHGHDRTPATMFVPALAMLVAAAVAGTMWKLADASEDAAHRFIDHAANAAAVLDGLNNPPAPHVASTGPPASMIVTALLTTLAALIVAAIGLWWQRLPHAWRELAGRTFVPPLHLLRRLHSGHVGDYVAWITLGTAALGGALLIVVPR